MSVTRTKQTSQRTQLMSAFGGKADITLEAISKKKWSPPTGRGTHCGVRRGDHHVAQRGLAPRSKAQCPLSGSTSATVIPRLKASVPSERSKNCPAMRRASILSPVAHAARIWSVLQTPSSPAMVGSQPVTSRRSRSGSTPRPHWRNSACGRPSSRKWP
jgi:hypothetical protein